MCLQELRRKGIAIPGVIIEQVAQASNIDLMQRRSERDIIGGGVTPHILCPTRHA